MDDKSEMKEDLKKDERVIDAVTIETTGIQLQKEREAARNRIKNQK